MKKNRYSFARTVLVALAALAVAESTNVSPSLHNALFDVHARWHAGITKPEYPTNLLIIGIDDASVRRFGRLRNWSRECYAALLTKTRSAKVVGVDILFTEPDEKDAAGDRALADAVKSAGNVVLPAFLYSEARPVSDETLKQTGAFLARLPPASADDFEMYPVLNAQTVEPPLPALTTSAFAVSQASVNADADNVYRRPVVAFVCRGADGLPRFVPHIATAIASAATGETVPALLRRVAPDNGALLTRPVTRRGGSYREGVGAPAPFLSLVDALAKPDSFYDGKIILLGETVTGTADIRPNALDNGLRGVELNAEIVANLMGVFAPLRDLPVLPGLLLALLAVAVPAWAWAFAPRITLAAWWGGGVFIVLLAVMETAYFTFGFVPPWSPVLIGFAFATLAAGIGRAAQEAENTRRTQEQFAAYVAPEQVAELSRNPGALYAAPRRIRCAVLFSDIRGFTAYSESTAPETVNRQMREYLTEMSAAVFARFHFLDKFIGDAVMALFGDLFDTGEAKNDAAESVRCAMEMLDRLDALNSRWSAEGLPTFTIGIGIHYGDALFGNVGAARGTGAGLGRVQLTALGDSVNLASRLQTATKEYPTMILVSGAVKEAAEQDDWLRGRVVWHDFGSFTVRGRENTTPIWGVERTNERTEN